MFLSPEVGDNKLHHVYVCVGAGMRACVRHANTDYYSSRFLIKLKLFGLFNVYINCSGSYWDNHVFDILVWSCLEITFYQCLQGSFTCHWRSNDDPMTHLSTFLIKQKSEMNIYALEYCFGLVAFELKLSDLFKHYSVTFE